MHFFRSSSLHLDLHAKPMYFLEILDTLEAGRKIIFTTHAMTLLTHLQLSDPE